MFQTKIIVFTLIKIQFHYVFIVIVFVFVFFLGRYDWKQDQREMVDKFFSGHISGLQVPQKHEVLMCKRNIQHWNQFHGKR